LDNVEMKEGARLKSTELALKDTRKKRFEM